MINIADLDKAAVLAALYNASKPQGMGFMDYDSSPMEIEDARQLLRGGQEFDYLKGRAMKVDLSGNEFDPWGFDRDNGENAALFVIEQLRASSNPNHPSIQEHHGINTAKALQDARGQMDSDYSGPVTIDGQQAYHLGLADRAKTLEPKLDQAERQLRRPS